MTTAPDHVVQKMVGKVMFEEPGPAKRGPLRSNPYKKFWMEVRDMLVANPGRWAMITDDTHLGVVNKIKNGKNPSFEPGLYQVTTRRRKDLPSRHVILYMRYIGEDGEFMGAEDYKGDV